ncbi:TrmH family RNA methyltransferase [Gillisia limnaea]|uniref:tRNA/rRNA methyltransferase (SpoU) n=1 Tax=Gillisia limnaea (strain DSM 15749 / LMG 21470 / R-8282) TaxID=865937 RepID=H2BZC3_GILLR|nr:TrmH family RNA methyltransferase [Gillisia limnaea]EHQ01252.1 tRNA/rRNA methyltransferase (SpoU) [Gillisia limnaea DSM 15749]
MSLQLAHKAHSNPQSKFPVVILTYNLMGDANIGSIFRLADAFNIEKIVFCGTPFNPENNRLKRTARSTLKNVAFEFQENAREVVEKFKKLKYAVFALEITSDSQILGSINFEDESKIVLIIGNERNGIDDSLLEIADKKVHIEMFGKNSSMNVAQATGIALYEITKTLPRFQKK